MILVTGGSGLTGSHLLLELSRKAEPLRVLKRNSSDISWVRRIFDYYEPEKGGELFFRMEWVDGDITDPDSLTAAFRDVTTVYHTAGYVSFDPGEHKRLRKINVEGTRHMVELSLKYGVEHFCHVSSVAALGKHHQGDELWVSETDYRKMRKERSCYGFSKLLGELEVWRAMEEGLRAVIVNPVIILGPGNWNRGSARLFKTMQNGSPFYPPGSNGFVDVRDVVRIMLLLTERRISGERFVINAENLSYRQVLSWMAQGFGRKTPSIRAGKGLMILAAMTDKMMSRLAGKPHLLTRETARTSSSHIFYNNEKIKSTLSYEFIPVKEAIDQAVTFFLSLTDDTDQRR